MPEDEDIVKSQAVCDWILTQPRSSDSDVKHESAVPVRVTIGEKSWLGALYCLLLTLRQNCRVVHEGPMAVGDQDRSYRLYLVGDRPHKKSGHLYVYDLPGEHRKPLEPCYAPDDEWYLASYWEGDGRDRFSAEELQRYHPFGPSFILCLHHIMNFGYYKGHKIDTFDERKAIRHPMTIEYLTAR